jgi:hypothetical protein
VTQSEVVLQLLDNIERLHEFVYEVSLPAYKDSDYKSLFLTFNATAKSILEEEKDNNDTPHA